MVLIEATQEKFGYDPRGLLGGSSKRILHQCDICGEIKERDYGILNTLRGSLFYLSDNFVKDWTPR